MAVSRRLSCTDVLYVASFFARAATFCSCTRERKKKTSMQLVRVYFHPYSCVKEKWLFHWTNKKCYPRPVFCVIRHVRRFAIQFNFQGEITFIGKWNYGATRLLPQIKYYHANIFNHYQKSKFENYFGDRLYFRTFLIKSISSFKELIFVFSLNIYCSFIMTLPRPMTNKLCIYASFCW
jgi:hypothetical protein